MVKYIVNFSLLPLIDETRQKAFEANKLATEYIDKSSLYKCKYQKDNNKFYPVKDALNKIYKNKCAYCETQINRTSTNIEHYRPKSLYYFLAYSWDNLLPICNMCNSKKSNRFELEDETKRIKSTIKSLKELQYISKLYNHIEKPKFIHPAIDNYQHLFRFNTRGEIVVYTSIVDSHRMSYTIENSDLNHHNLLKRRAKVLQDFITIRDELFYLFYLAKKHKDKEELDEFKKRTNEKIKSFFNDENEFLAVRKFIIERLRFYLMRKDKIFVKFFKGYLLKYIKNIEVYNKK